MILTRIYFQFLSVLFLSARYEGLQQLAGEVTAINKPDIRELGRVLIVS